MKMWLDDLRLPPKGYTWVRSVNEAKELLIAAEEAELPIEELNLDHDLGDYAKKGGDGIRFVRWLAATERYYPVVLHTMNPVGRENMQAIVDRYWR